MLWVRFGLLSFRRGFQLDPALVQWPRQKRGSETCSSTVLFRSRNRLGLGDGDRSLVNLDHAKDHVQTH